MSDKVFTEAQKQFMSGLVMGADVARSVQGLPTLSSRASTGATVTLGGSQAGALSNAPEVMGYAAQDKFIAAGKKLSAEEKAKREKNPLDMWDEIAGRAAEGVFPKGTDTFLTKFQGLFYVAPAQDAFMCRLRIPGGEIHAHQLDGLADLADNSAGGTLDVTTRANLQLRNIPAQQAMNILYGVRDLGLWTLGSGGDNIRNVTASPLSGIDPDELIETLPIAKRMHHYILSHREMYGLPRKFNIAYDGGGQISALDDTNDIGFHAVKVTQQHASDELPEGVYFQLTLGGITGHKDFARDTGILLTADETLDVAGAIIRVFIKNGDRTDRKKARLKYVLDDWGFDKFIVAVEEQLGWTLRRAESNRWERPAREQRLAHVDFHTQSQPALKYVGVVFPVGRMTSDQARGLAAIARRHGTGRLRLTVWQNLIIPDIADHDCEAVSNEIERLGLHTRATNIRAGLIACTGSSGCKYAAADTKSNAMELAEYLENRFELDQPINIHLTGCHHSCAQHYIGDIGLIGAKVEVGDDVLDGYDILVGGGWGDRQGIAREVAVKVAWAEVPGRVAGIVAAYLEQRLPDEPFHRFVARHTDAELRELPLEHIGQ